MQKVQIQWRIQIPWRITGMLWPQKNYFQGAAPSKCYKGGTWCVHNTEADTVVSGGWQQCAKKVVSNSPGLVVFAIRLVIFVLNLPDGQVLCFGEIQITEGL